MRFFFDCRTRDQSLYDCRGEEFRNHHTAAEFAEAMAEDLKYAFANDWIGWWIEVRNAEGVKFLSVSVDAAGALAA